MNYVKSFDLFGVPATQIPATPGSGAPTAETEGAVGCLYMDTDTGDLYKCTAAGSGAYEWTAIEEGGGGVLSQSVKDALLECFKHVAWTDENGATYIANLQTALASNAGALESITAVYSGGSVAEGTDLAELRQNLVVTGTYSDGTQAEVSAYTLSGSIEAGTNTVTVTYRKVTATFTVEGIASYSVTYDLDNVAIDSTTEVVIQGGYYSATLSVADGYVIAATITMGGVDITADVYTEDGTILITEVTGDIVITATAEEKPIPMLYQLANTPRTVNADLFEDTGLTFGSTTANGYTKAWTMVARVSNMTAGALWCVNGQSSALASVYENRWNNDAGNKVAHLTTYICSTVARPSITQANPNEICIVITKDAMVEKTATMHYLSYAGELTSVELVGINGKFNTSTYAGNMMVGGQTAADFVGTIEEFTIYEGVATEDQIKSYLGVA